MIKHEITPCPRCGKTFECKVGSILLCQCTTVELNQEERDYINEWFDDCLCASCMKDLKAEYRSIQQKETKTKYIGNVK
ncbi:MAG: cysteine-rich CWC family protein [Bacteroidota bacterium]